MAKTKSIQIIKGRATALSEKLYADALRKSDALGARLDTFSCEASDKSMLPKAVEYSRQREKERLEDDASHFIDTYAESIIENAAAGVVSGEEALEIKNKIKELDPLLGAELLLAIKETGNVKELQGIIDSLSNFDLDVSCSLLYEIRITGNVVALTDSRLFESQAVDFFNRLGTESASEWFNSVGRTGNVSALASKEVLSDSVLDAINGNAKVAGDLSYAIGETGKLYALTNEEFLEDFRGLTPDKRSELLSAAWCTGRVEEFTNKETIGKVAGGELDLWKDIKRAVDWEHRAKTSRRVVIARLGDDEHDRGAKLVVQSLINSGFNVTYLNNPRSPEEIAQAAISSGASAIGFSMTGDSHYSIAARIQMHIRAQGLDNIAIFGGGLITQSAAGYLQQSGVRIFAQGATKNEMVAFLNASASRHTQPMAYTSGSDKTQNRVPRGGASVYARAPDNVSNKSWHASKVSRLTLPALSTIAYSDNEVSISRLAANDTRSVKAAALSVQISGQPRTGARLERSFEAATPQSQEKASRKGKESAQNLDIKAGALKHESDVNDVQIRVRAPIITNTTRSDANNASTIGGASASSWTAAATTVARGEIFRVYSQGMNDRTVALYSVSARVSLSHAMGFDRLHAIKNSSTQNLVQRLNVIQNMTQQVASSKSHSVTTPSPKFLTSLQKQPQIPANIRLGRIAVSPAALASSTRSPVVELMKQLRPATRQPITRERRRFHVLSSIFLRMRIFGKAFNGFRKFRRPLLTTRVNNPPRKPRIAAALTPAPVPK